MRAVNLYLDLSVSRIQLLDAWVTLIPAVQLSLRSSNNIIALLTNHPNRIYEILSNHTTHILTGTMDC